MKTRLKVIVGLIAVLPLLVTSCFKDNSEDFPDFNEQLVKDLETIDNYLEANNIPNVQQDPGGFIRYVIHRDSVGGKKPTLDSCVTANYVGKLLMNGQQFDDGTNISFPLNSVIDGWKIGIPLLNVGDSATLYIPSGLGYGYYGFEPDIPSNANLIFNVGVTKVGTTYKSSDRSCN